MNATVNINNLPLPPLTEQGKKQGIEPSFAASKNFNELISAWEALSLEAKNNREIQEQFAGFCYGFFCHNIENVPSEFDFVVDFFAQVPEKFHRLLALSLVKSLRAESRFWLSQQLMLKRQKKIDKTLGELRTRKKLLELYLDEVLEAEALENMADMPTEEQQLQLVAFYKAFPVAEAKLNIKSHPDFHLASEKVRCLILENDLEIEKLLEAKNKSKEAKISDACQFVDLMCQYSKRYALFVDLFNNNVEFANTIHSSIRVAQLRKYPDLSEHLYKNKPKEFAQLLNSERGVSRGELLDYLEENNHWLTGEHVARLIEEDVFRGSSLGSLSRVGLFRYSQRAQRFLVSDRGSDIFMVRVIAWFKDRIYGAEQSSAEKLLVWLKSQSKEDLKKNKDFLRCLFEEKNKFFLEYLRELDPTVDKFRPDFRKERVVTQLHAVTLLEKLTATFEPLKNIDQLHEMRDLFLEESQKNGDEKLAGVSANDSDLLVKNPDFILSVLNSSKFDQDVLRRYKEPIMDFLETECKYFPSYLGKIGGKVNASDRYFLLLNDNALRQLCEIKETKAILEKVAEKSASAGLRNKLSELQLVPQPEKKFLISMLSMRF